MLGLRIYYRPIWIGCVVDHPVPFLSLGTDVFVVYGEERKLSACSQDGPITAVGFSAKFDAS
jgi:hypothetical protein